MTRVALHGAGRMSAAIVQAAIGQTHIDICAVVSPRPPQWGAALTYYPALEQLEPAPEVLIDFSLPDGTAAAADWCSRSGVALLSGVTGLHQKAQDGLTRAARKVPVLWSANMSLGVNLLVQLCARTAGILPAETAITIEDVHHQWKKDAPSGTSLMLGEAIERARGECTGKIEYVSLRQGEAIGRHEVTFSLAGEKMVLSHEALDRSIFARGALAAAQWLGRQAPGRYTAADWLSRFAHPED